MREDAVGLDERQFMNAGKLKSNTCMIELANYVNFLTNVTTSIILDEGNFWFRFRLFIQFLALRSMDEKVGKVDNRAEAEFKIALVKYYHQLYRVKDSRLDYSSATA